MIRWGWVLLFLSVIPIVQSVRELGFWRNGMARFEEQPAYELPIRFAGHVIMVEDTLAHTDTRSQDEVPGTARVLIDGREVLPALPARIRPGLNTIGRYVFWVDANVITDKRTGERAFYLARRRKASLFGGRSYDLLRMSADGSYTLRRLSSSQRAESYPVWRTVQFLHDIAEPAYDFSVLAIWPSIIVPGIYPLATLVLGIVLVVLGRWRARRAAEAAATSE